MAQQPDRSVGSAQTHLDEQQARPDSDTTNLTLEMEQLREETRALQERLQIVMQECRDGIWDWDCETGQVYWNDRLYEIFGLQRETDRLPKEAICERIHPDDLEIVTARLNDHFQEGAPYEFELRMRHASGNYRIIYIRGNAVRNADGQPVRMVGLMTDMTELREANLAIRESEDRFRHMADAVPTLIGLTDQEGKAIFYNRACLEFAGSTLQDLLEHSWMRFVYPQDAEALIETYQRHIPAQQPFSFEYRGIRHDGVIRTLMNTGVPRFRPDGTFMGYVLLAVDITEQRQYSARFKRVVDSNMLGIMFWKADGTVTDANDAYLEIMGYTRDDLTTGKINWQQLTTQAAKPTDDLIWAELAEKGVAKPYEKHYLRPDGTIVDVMIGVALLEAGNLKEGIAFYLDMTEQKKNQFALQDSLSRESLNRRVLEITNAAENIPDILEVVSQEIGQYLQADRCMLIYYEPVAREAGRYTAQLFHQYRASDRITPLSFDEFSPRLRQVMMEKMPEQFLTATRNVSTLSDFFLNVKTYLNEIHLLPGEADELLNEFRILWQERYEIKSYLRIGIQFRDKLYGSLVLHHCHRSRAWGDAEMALLGDLTKYLGAAFYQLELLQHQQAMFQELERSYQLIHLINEAQSHFITHDESHLIFQELLNRILDYTQSEYGFIGEVLHDAEGRPYLRAGSLNELFWNQEVHPLSSGSQQRKPELNALNLLIEPVLATGKRLISNEFSPILPLTGQALEKPIMTCSIGLPLYKGEELVGILGLLNRPGGYDDILAEELQPYLLACANIIANVRSEALKKHLTHELQLSERALKTYTARLEKSNEELEQFATIVSHDLQAPLRKVSIFSDYLQTAGSPLSDECHDYIARIQKATRKMQTLITDLLALSRVGRKGKPFTSVDLQEVVQDVLSDLRESVRESNGQIEVGPLMSLDADRLQVHQLLYNLLDNALKFHRKGVPPFIRVQAVPLNEQACQITVQDNGIGFDKKYLERVFLVFERLHGEQEYQGTGMGLAVVKKIAERHGGTVSAQSKPNLGATFIVTLPIHHQ